MTTAPWFHEYSLARDLSQLAGVSARRGERDEALAFLRRALNQGAVDASVAENQEFASLRGDPEFEVLTLM